MLEGGPMAANDETMPITEYAVRKLDGYGLSHLLLMGNTTDFTGTPLEPLMGDGMARHFRPIFRGKLIANVGTGRVKLSWTVRRRPFHKFTSFKATFPIRKRSPLFMKRSPNNFLGSIF
jgi:hypothetical protein